MMADSRGFVGAEAQEKHPSNQHPGNQVTNFYRPQRLSITPLPTSRLYFPLSVSSVVFRLRHL